MHELWVSYLGCEVMNKCVETYLKCLVGGQTKNWLQWLPWAEWCFNISYYTFARFTLLE